MSFITVVAKLFSDNETALRELAGYEANSQVYMLGLQLGRLRTAKEQMELLTAYYNDTLQSLKELDESGICHLLLMLQPDTGVSLDQVEAATDKFSSFMGSSGQLDETDLAQLADVDLASITKEHPAYELLSNYKNYLAQQDFLDRVKELMDLSESLQQGEKLSDEEIKEAKDEKTAHLTAAQKVLALHYLMRWSGIEAGPRQGARHQRFIAALTGISVGTVKEKFPTAEVASRPQHLDNLSALVVLFEAAGALKQAEKIQRDIDFEREERDQ